MKIFAAGVVAETNTFCPFPTGLEDFAVLRGTDAPAGRVVGATFDLSNTWGQRATARRDAFVFSLMAWAPPGGLTVKSAYESLRDEILEDLRSAMPVDVVLLMLHGAMAADGYEDCEQDLISRVRVIAGVDAIIAVEMDLHCHLYPEKIAAANIVVTYKEYPHIDINDRAVELFDLAIAAKQRQIRPAMALFDCRMMGSYPTTRQPLRGLVDAMTKAEQREGILSISFAHGFRSADVPHAGAKVLVVADGNPDLAERVAREFGLAIYRMRREIGFESVSLPLEVALKKALESGRTPVVVADQSDNVGGGAPGDATHALRWLLDHGAQKVATGILYDPAVVALARKVGVGATVSVRLGGKMSASSGEPLDLEVSVLSILDNYVHLWPQRTGAPLAFFAGNVVALRHKSIDIVVSSERCQCISPTVFADLGIDARRKRLLIPKSNQHFYDGFSGLAGEVIYMAGPGAVPPDPRRLSYRRLKTDRFYPWVEDPLALDQAGQPE